MNPFVQRHEKDVIGVLSGFDRVLFRGTLRSICYPDGLERFLNSQQVRFKDFKPFAEGLTQQIKEHAKQVAAAAGRPCFHLSNPAASKEEEALAIARRDGITEGLVCVLGSTEPCFSFSIRRGPTGRFGFVREYRKCEYLYYYYLDRQFGLMHVRLMTWLPFGIQVCVNGREYLARRMGQAGIGFEQRDNCFVRIDDLARAQAMLSELEDWRWERFLTMLARRVNPFLKGHGGVKLFGYYWSVRQSELATDVMFKDPAALARVYPALVEEAIKRFGSVDVLRFLGRRTSSRFAGEVSSSVVRRDEGVRVKHWVEENSIKMYDKQGSVLRIETTINNVTRFKSRRITERKGVRRMRWIAMRQGVVDLARRVEVSRAANERYLKALAEVVPPLPARDVLDPVSRRVVENERPYRPLRPVSKQDAEVFRVVLSGRFLLRGFSNRDLREQLAPGPCSDQQERRRRSGRVTRLLRLLRAHGLIQKVSGTRYYRVTARGHQVMSTALVVRDANVAKLAA